VDIFGYAISAKRVTSLAMRVVSTTVVGVLQEAPKGRQGNVIAARNHLAVNLKLRGRV
jgi:hypothetical protein